MNINDEIIERLMENQDLKYRDFHSKLVPTKHKDSFIGVRTPVLRKLGKEYAKHSDVQEFLDTLPHKYYEENNIHGFIIETYKDYDKCVSELNKFLPYIDNWGTCDLISPKVFAKIENKTKLLKEIERWIASDEVYTIRYAVNMLMKHFLDEDFDEKYLQMVADIDNEDYYVKMVVAWYFATALAKQYDAAVTFLENKCLDVWTHNKTISKARESYRITDDKKEYLKGLKIKK